MKWVPPRRSLWPTNQRRTLLGWVLSSSLQNCFACTACYWWLSIYTPVLFWDVRKEKIFLYDSSQQSEGFCGLCQASKILTWTIWSSWVCSGTRELFENKGSCEVAACRVRNSRSKEVAPREQTNRQLCVSDHYWSVKFSPVRDSDLAWFSSVSASSPSLLLCRACQKWKRKESLQLIRSQHCLSSAESR